MIFPTSEPEIFGVQERTQKVSADQTARAMQPRGRNFSGSESSPGVALTLMFAIFFHGFPNQI